MFPLNLFLGRLFRRGTLNVIDVRGRTHVFAGAPGPEVTIRIHSRALYWKIFLRPAMAVGEGYMEGDLTVEDGDILDFLRLALANMQREPGKTQRRWGLHGLVSLLRQINPTDRSRRNVAHHYDFTLDFFDMFLDPSRQYSCAYFRTPGDTLEQAQRNKMNHIAGKLLLEPDHRVIEIGCGWGGLAAHLNAVSGCHVTGVTLSQEQFDAARDLAARQGKTDKLEFYLQDYREVSGTFDRVASIAMFEAVGVPQYQTYFDKISELLNEDGVALVHTIGRTDGPGSTSGWTNKYIFPGGYSPALSEIMPAIERSGLILADLEVWRLHYARTAEIWYRRFQEKRDAIKDLYDERFCRMFEFYLAGCVGSFESGELAIFHLQLVKKQDAVPLTRDYLYEPAEAAEEPVNREKIAS